MSMFADAGISGHESEPHQSVPAGHRTSRSQRKVILLIEDNEADRDIYGGLLWYNGFEVVHAADGPAGVARARNEAPDAILLDMTLPGGMSGLEVLERLKADGCEAPVIALTARPEEELGREVREMGAVAYLEKPITPFEVVRHVMQVVGPAAGDGAP